MSGRPQERTFCPGSASPSASAGGSQRKAFASIDVRRIFNSIAPLYDLGNHLFSAGLDHRWRSRAVAACDPRPGQRVLDLCCGTADLAVALRKREPQVRIVGCDFSGPMLARARKKLRRARFVAADALALPLGDETMDGVVCGFGLRNFSDPEAGLAEMVRVVRPGGRLVILEFYQPEGSGSVGRLFRLYFRHILPTLGRWLSGREAYRYLVESVQRFGPLGATAERMRRAGLAEVKVKPLPGGIAAVYAARRPATA